MNLLLVVNVVSPYPGNLLESLFALENSICADGGKTVYVFPAAASDMDWVQGMRQSGKKIYFKPAGKKSPYALYNRVIHENDIDIIYLHFWNIPDALAVKALKMKYKGLRFVIHHHSEYHVSDSPLRERIKHWILDADMHIGCGEYVFEQVRAAGYRNVRWIDNCIDFERLEQWEPYETPDGLNLLTFSGIGYEIKGVDISVRGVRLARERGIPANLLIAIGADYDGIERRVREECGGTIPEWIRLLPARPDVATYYHAVDAYLNSSRSEGFCYASAEAINCGAQVIQTNIPQNHLDIPETLIYEVGNAEQLADRIETLYQQKQEGDVELKRRQKDYVVGKYSLSIWVEEEKRALESLLP